MQLFQHLDSFLGRYPHIVSALEALSTFAAVITSLFLAYYGQRQNRTRLDASVFISEIQAATVNPKVPPRYLTVTVTNTGVFPLHLPYAFFSFKVPLRRGFLAVLPLDAAGDSLIPKRSYPFRVEPRTNEWFSVTTEKKLYESLFENLNKEPAWRKPLLRYMYAVIATQDGRRFRVKLPKEIRTKLTAIGKTSAPEVHP